MFGRTVLCLAALSASWALPAASDAHPNFTGTWKLNEVLSGTPLAGPREIVFKIEHNDPNFKYSATGKHNFNAAFSEAYEFTTDGKSPADASKIGVLGTWEGPTLVLRYVKGGKELFTFRFRLSPDGKQMTREAVLSGDRKIREIYDREP